MAKNLFKQFARRVAVLRVRRREYVQEGFDYEE